VSLFALLNALAISFLRHTFGHVACRLDGGAKAVSAKLGELWKELSKEERDHWIEVARVQSEKNEKEKPVAEKVCLNVSL
jgi:hypothetical protein